MITIRLYSKRMLFAFLEEEYASDKVEKSFSGVSSGEIVSFFAPLECDKWQVIDFEGKPDDISEYMALLTNKFFAKYFLALYLPMNGNIDAATAVHQKVEVCNLCKFSDPLFSMCLNDDVKDGTVKFRLVAPKYSYSDVWEQQNK